MRKSVICLYIMILIPVLAACGKATDSESSQEMSMEKNAEIGDIRYALEEVFGDAYWPDTLILPEELEEYGLHSDIYDDFYGEECKEPSKADVLIVICAKEGKVEEAEEVLNNYREALVANEDSDSANIGKVLASRIETMGNYVCFVQLGADITVEYWNDGDNAAVIRHCQEHNELAIEAIGKKLGG